MKVVKQSWSYINPFDGVEICKKLEIIGRTCYKSEDKITEVSFMKFIPMLISRKHWSIFEHEIISVRLITNRAVTHEIVRHRLASYAQESQRYINYSIKNDGEMQFIEPHFKEDINGAAYSIWEGSMILSEKNYNHLIKLGCKPEEAREVLPNATKTEIVITANLREWRYILTLRTQANVYPPLKELMCSIHEHFKLKVPFIFDNLGE